MIKTRIAPSPTGELHIGTLKNIVLTWLWSRKNKADFVFRIDDTDKKRSNEKYLDNIYKVLKAYKITPTKIFKQSQREDLYKSVLQKCIKHNLVYPVTESEAELEARNSRIYKKYVTQNVANENKAVYYRFDIGSNILKFKDRIRGEISISLDKISDPIVQKPNGEFTYSFASIIDDLTEGITMIIRASDHIDNTAVQLAMMSKMIKVNIFPKSEIEFAHYPIFLYQGKKISKRLSSELAIMDSFHPVVLANYITLSGMSCFGREYYKSLEELSEVFSLEHQPKSNTINIDLNQLDKYQRKSFMKMNSEDLEPLVRVNLTEEQWKLIRGNINKVEDISLWERIFTDQNLHFTTYENNSEMSSNIHKKRLFLRHAMTGQNFGPDVQALIDTMDPKIVEYRIKKCKTINTFLYNSLTRQTDFFRPIDPNNIKIYCCGPTLYSDPHLGNYRCFANFDVLFRLMRAIYGKVTYVRNITDIDDKIVAQAKLKNKTPDLIVSDALVKFSKGQTRLNLLKPTMEPRVIDYIADIILLIEKLIVKGFAYQKSDGVYFKIDNLNHYDLFCTKRDISSEENDFALWRNNEEYGWDSPWGKGRPGWHIECTAMSLKNLKLPFDIHCGGKDLMFPHHTNECAQAAALGYGVTANYWLHNEFVNVENAAKMSKSLNNCVTLSSLEVSGPIIRLALLRTHYKDPLNWSENTILDSSVIYNKWRRVLGNYLIANNLRWPIKKKGFVFPEVLEILSKNLNTPLAISYLDNKIEKLKNSDFSFYLDLIESFDLLGIIFNMSYINDAAVKEMVEARDRHKREKNYMAADKIRETLKSEGILLQDGPNCTLWYKYE